MKVRVRVGRVSVYPWAGSWMWWPSYVPCPGCRNLYVGPFGVEVERRPPTDDEVEADRWDEGWHAAVIAFCPPDIEGGWEGRLLWALENMPHGNPYRETGE